MRVLVTGSYGLVGAALERAMESRGHEVVPFDLVRDGAGPPENINDCALLASRLTGCDGIVHLAAISRVAWGEVRPDLCERTNVEGTRAVTEAALESAAQPWLLFASSREVYGNPARSLVLEDDPIAPVNTYGRSKAAGETILAMARESGLRTAIIRLSNVYGGRRDHPDRAVPGLLMQALRHEDIVITGGDNYSDFVHVEDCVTGLLSAVDQLAAGERALPPVHLTTGVATSLRHLAGLAMEVAASRSKIKEAPARPFDVAGFCGDPARAKSLLGWQADVELRTGMVRLAEDLRRNGPLEKIEIPDPGLPASFARSMN